MLDFSTWTAAQQTLMKRNLEEYADLDSPSLFILKNGWAAATTRQYAAAVNKYFSFLDQDGKREEGMPATKTCIYGFVLWCSTTERRPVLSKTTARYLTGLRMWHALHDKPFPSVNLHRIRLLLKGCKMKEIQKDRTKRVGLTLQDLLDLSDRLTTSSTIDLVTKAVLLTGFWGLARLGELTRHVDHPEVFIRRKDLTFSTDGKRATIRIRLAKTASPGEVQLIQLRAQPNRLDPINVLFELLRRVPMAPDDPLFPGRMLNEPIRKGVISRFLKANGPCDSGMWTGHSLRIGGTSLRANLGQRVKSLKSLGRWKSSAYKLYIKRYSPTVLENTLSLAAHIHF